MERVGELRTIWALSDGRAGNVAQALGLAEALGTTSGAEVVRRDISLRTGAAQVPAGLSHRLGKLWPRWPDLALAGGFPAPPWPDLAIGAGRRVAPTLAAMKRLCGVRTVQLLDPQMEYGAFDRIVVPAHDRVRHPNVIETLGALNRVTPARIGAGAERLRPLIAHLPEPRIGVLIGGPSGSAIWNDKDRERFVEAMLKLIEAGNALVMTPSRRTDPGLVRTLRARCDASAIWLWNGLGDNPYPGILGVVSAVVVTEDSVNMTSEAAVSGLPVHVFRISRLGAKLRSFHRSMVSHGITRPFNGEIETWSYTPLVETDRVAAILSADLGLAPVAA